MNILYVTSEAVPFCKTGGLADVAGSLPQALAKRGHQVSVILPLYQTVREKWLEKLTYLRYTYVRLAWRNAYCGLFRLEQDGVTFYFIDNEQYFARQGLYGHYDDGERFAFFSRAVTELLPTLDPAPQIVHCNDWQSALVPIMIRDEAVRNEFYKSIRTVLTIHNVEYQGRYGKEVIEDLFGLNRNWYDDGTLAQDGDVNLLKGGILVSDAVTAVSPTYAEELLHPAVAHGLDSVLRLCQGKLHGVLNGIDMVRYNPATDADIFCNYSKEKCTGKLRNKTQLQKSMGLQENPQLPVVAMVSRLVGHKGLDLVCDALDGLMRNTDMQLVVVGQGDGQYESFFSRAAQQYAGRVAVHIGYSESLAMQVYAGADLFLMPSKSEPCGLSQMIAMRYGTVPIVRETGGLKDTVTPYEAWCNGGTGFTFAPYHAADLGYVTAQAVRLFHEEPEAFRALQERAMDCDFSWNRSAGVYESIYAELCAQ